MPREKSDSFFKAARLADALQRAMGPARLLRGGTAATRLPADPPGPRSDWPAGGLTLLGLAVGTGLGFALARLIG
jgi:hypothetical protein